MAYRKADFFGVVAVLIVAAVFLWFAIWAGKAFAQTVTLTPTPTTAVSPASITLTWSSTGVSSCTASGGTWSGVKATSGTETLSNVLTSATYVLTCSEGTGQAALSWTAPTLNTDGTTIPATGPGSLSGFRVYWAQTVAGVPNATPLAIVNATTRTRTVTGLGAGTWHFGVKALNMAGVESDMSGIASKTVTLATASATAAVTVNTKPAPPVLTVATTVKLFRKDGTFGAIAGTIPKRTQCNALAKKTKLNGSWYYVNRSNVSLNKTGRQSSLPVVAKCA